MTKPVLEVSDKVQHITGCMPQKMVGGLKLENKEVKFLYLCSKYKGTYKLRGHCTLRFHIRKNQGFSWHGSYYMSLVVRKPDFGVSNQVRHKPGCTATEDG